LRVPPFVLARIALQFSLGSRQFERHDELRRRRSMLVASVWLTLLSYDSFFSALMSESEGGLRGSGFKLSWVPIHLELDIIQMLERFALQMEAHEGFIRHILHRTPAVYSLVPQQMFMKLASVNFTSLERNAQIVERRLRHLIDRASGILTAVRP
jgi:hypothetical protein